MNRYTMFIRGAAGDVLDKVCIEARSLDMAAKTMKHTLRQNAAGARCELWLNTRCVSVIVKRARTRLVMIQDSPSQDSP